MAVAVSSLLAALSTVAMADSPKELPTSWEAPPGDPLEHETAGFAKILCSAIFITGRDLEDGADGRTGSS